MSGAKLKKFLLRYYPPGIILEYEQEGRRKQKNIDLLDLHQGTDVEVVLSHMIREEPLLSEQRRPALRQLVHRLQEKMASDVYQSSFNLVKVLRAHILPLTNCAFNKSGDRFITGSYDRTCKVWDTHSGEEVHTLEGHKNVVRARRADALSWPPSQPSSWGDGAGSGSAGRRGQCMRTGLCID
mmetsp:Transcript_24626/g.58582  ORF Transcript_24626/g.58582 Transcript_24626/m.58582 type:complete len:183 (-) Transcript_24626:1355-1903(-)